MQMDELIEKMKAMRHMEDSMPTEITAKSCKTILSWIEHANARIEQQEQQIAKLTAVVGAARRNRFDHAGRECQYTCPTAVRCANCQNYYICKALYELEQP